MTLNISVRNFTLNIFMEKLKLVESPAQEEGGGEFSEAVCLTRTVDTLERLKNY